jgi:NADH:ubiquinone oxidoreductase subunit 5 (subunit L)/multisubunit Na+/H+ antiporter MnhA subunit
MTTDLLPLLASDGSGARLLVALVPGLPLVAMLTIAVLRPGHRAATRVALAGTTATGLGAGILLALTGGGALPSPGGWLLADRVGAAIALLAATVAVTVLAYAGRALAGDRGGVRFAALAAGLTAATSTLALAGNLLVLAAGWIAVGALLVAALAIRPGHAAVDLAVRRTRRSFLVGDAALVAAVALVTATAGPVVLDRRLAPLVAELAATTVPGPLALPVLDVVAVLVVVAAVSRSALLPLHRWLPATLAAPTPVSALLHAGVVNGAGVLLLALGPVVLASTAGTWLAFGLGVATAVVSLGVMLVRSDIKGALAWSTSAQMGFMVVQLAIGAFGAALVHLIGHGLYKAAAFLGAGGRVSAVARARHRQLPTAPPSTGVLLTGRIVVPLLATGAAFALVRPGFEAAKLLLVTVLLAVTLAHLLAGWLATSPVGSVATLLVGALVAPLLGSLYLGGIMLVERVVGAALPTAGPAAIGVVPLAATLAGITALVVFVRVAPASARSGVHAWLVGIGTALPAARVRSRGRRLRPVPAGASSAPEPARAAYAASTSATPTSR